MNWQVQQAKQRFSELLERARSEGPQVVTKHGRPVAVLLDIERYRELSGDGAAFKAFLRRGPGFEVPARDGARPIDL